ncbi:MAG: gliding motility-associated C-terminal domain-containing protein, partial [Bacteroidia bacterium]|nr:gliding motility-associated C-terminal domain-containing protein [Bacteroidia bacterium]
SPISGPITACESDTGIFYNVTPVSGNYSWTVLGGTITSGQNTDVISINWDSSGTGTISVVDTNSFGCPGPVQNITVIINALPDTASSIYGPITVCENSVQSYYVIPNAGSTYEWICTGGVVLSQTPSADMIQIQWGPSGSGSLSVLERNSSSCAGPDTLIFITINPRPLPPVVQGDASICNNSQSVYWIPFTAGSQWSWSIIGGTIDSVNANTDSVTVSWTSPGINYISVFEINLSSCSSDTTIFPVTVFQEPVAVASPDSAALCQNIAFPLTGTAIGLVQWISSGSGTFNDPTLPSPIYTPGISDTGFVQLQMIASTSLCPNDTATVVLYVSPAPIVTITGTSNTICFGQNDTLRVQGGGTYLWTPGGSIDSVLVVSPPLTTTYHVTVTNGVGCSSEDSVTVTVNPPGIPNAGSDQLLCRGDSATLFGTQAGGGGYFWSSAGDGFFIPNTSDQQVIYVPGLLDSSSGQVQIILTTTGYCLNLTDTLNLQITGLPSIDAGRDTTVTSGPGSGVSIPLSPTLLNASGVLWSSSGTGTFSPTDTTLTATYTPSDEDFTLDSVILTAFVTGACIVTGDVLTIQFIPFEIPNVFTPYPSSPGLNDYFEIKNLPRNTGLKIWNRWGLIVFVAEDYLNNWEAAGLEADVYYYALTTAHKEYKGWIQILRE